MIFRVIVALPQGVYHDDIRDGEGVMTYPGGRQDVGIWKGSKLIRLRFTVAEAIFDPSASLSSLGPLDSSLGTNDHKSRGKFGPKGPLEVPPYLPHLLTCANI